MVVVYCEYGSIEDAVAAASVLLLDRVSEKTALIQDHHRDGAGTSSQSSASTEFGIRLSPTRTPPPRWRSHQPSTFRVHFVYFAEALLPLLTTLSTMSTALQFNAFGKLRSGKALDFLALGGRNHSHL